MVLIVLISCVTGGAREGSHVPGRILIKPKPQLSEAEFSRRVIAQGAQHRRTLPRTNVRVLAVPEERADSILAALRNDPDIEFAERDYVAHACATSNDPYVVSGTEWHLAKIQAPQAWAITAGTSNVVIAVLDSGVNAAHPDLAGRLLPGYDFVNDDGDPADDFGHGTAVTGAIVAKGNNGLGVAGVAYNCVVLPVKVLDDWGSASHSTIAQGIEYAVQQGARIINLSLGGDWPSTTLQNAINYAWSNNVVVIAAAGNNANTVPQYPGACDHVLAVAATESDDSRASFSNYGSYVTLFAPGDNIWTTQRDLAHPYGAWRGTSFACPVVVGVAALMLSLNPALSNREAVDILKQTADDVGTLGYDPIFPHTRVNALRAVSAITPVPPVIPPLPDPIDPVPDTVAPSITIVTSPPNGARLTSPILNCAGNAEDNVGIDHVEVQVNGGPTQFADGTTRWTAQVVLTPGYNLVRVRSVDRAGNHSSELTRAFTYVMLVPLTVRTNGLGAVVSVQDSSQFEVGRTYRIKAVPGTGQLFAGWSGGVASPSATLSFTMQTNLTLVANFVPNPFPAVRGRYAGLMVNKNTVTPDNSGYFAVAISGAGSFTGQLRLSGQHYGFSGKLNLSGDATVTVRRGLALPLALTLHVDLTNGSDVVAGSVNNGAWTSDLTADRNTFNAVTNPAPQAGLRSFVLDRELNNERAATGFSRILLNGGTNLRGKLNDGRAFSAGSALGRNGDVPFYVSLNRGAEVVIGWLNFPAGQLTIASGTVLWVSGTNGSASTLQAAAGPP